MIDLKNKRCFLKKSACPPEISSNDLYIGALVTLYSRELEIVDYGDNFTRQRQEKQKQPCIAISDNRYEPQNVRKPSQN